ncbi:MAG: preprotein translocase subunit SecY [Bacteriovoracaceae bacterium]|nr:preprotein translocase subunit SecY [Bacteriovoracaceae bacterium]
MTQSQGKLDELKKRILFTILMLAIFRIVAHIPTPGVDSDALISYFKTAQSSIFGMFDAFTGGSLQRFSVLALGVMPYITSSIIFSLLTISFPTLGELQKEAGGHKKIQQFTRYGAVLLCIVQGYGLAVGLEALKSQNGMPVVLDPGFSFRFLTIVTLAAGTIFLMWMGEQITERGIGNGVSLIIFAGIASSIPSGIINTINLFKTGELGGMSLLVVLALMFATFWFIIFMEKSFRKVPVQYAKRVVNNRVFGGQSTHLPIKINISGVMPPIFAYALMGFPATIAQFIPATSGIKKYVDAIQQSLFPGGMFYSVMLVTCIIFFAYFYASIQFKTDDISEMLKKNGGFVPGIRPGERTAEFLNFIVARLTLVGALYVALICVLPSILLKIGNVPFQFGGTSLLILVGVAIDTMAQVESFMISQRYDSAYKVRGKRTLGRRF